VTFSSLVAGVLLLCFLAGLLIGVATDDDDDDDDYGTPIPAGA